MGKTINKVKKTVSLAERAVQKAKEELHQEREENLRKRAKGFLEELQEAKKTVSLLEKQFKNWMREVDSN